MKKKKPSRGSKAFEMTTLEQMEVMASPTRHEIHQALDLLGPCPVHDIAVRMNRKPETLYYHVNPMIDAGLVVVVGEQIVNRRVEKILDLPGRPFRVSPENVAPKFLASIRRSIAARLRLATRRAQAEVVAEDCVRQGPLRTWRLEQIHGRLGALDRRRLNRMLDEIVEFIRERDDPQGELVLTTLVTTRLSRPKS